MITAICIVGLVMLIVGAAASSKPRGPETREEMVRRNDEMGKKVANGCMAFFVIMLIIGVIASLFQ